MVLKSVPARGPLSMVLKSVPDRGPLSAVLKLVVVRRRLSVVPKCCLCAEAPPLIFLLLKVTTGLIVCEGNQNPIKMMKMTSWLFRND